MTRTIVPIVTTIAPNKFTKLVQKDPAVVWKKELSLVTHLDSLHSQNNWEIAT